MNGTLYTNSWAGLVKTPVEIVRETPMKYRVKLLQGVLLPGRGQHKAGEVVMVPKTSVKVEGAK